MNEQPRATRGRKKLNENVEVTDENAPCALIVRNLKWPEDPVFPIVVMPEGGFKTKEQAIEVAESYKDAEDMDGRRGHYLDLHFTVAGIMDPAMFARFCSW